jgi:hypothetical protein
MIRVRRVQIALIFCLLGASAARAQDESNRVAALRFHEGRLKRMTHYVTTHKELLISDTLIVFTQAADAASSVHCQRLPGCVESNPLLGKHPSELETWGAATGASAATITLVHLSQLFASNRIERHLFWGPVAGICIREVWNVHSNANEAEFLQRQQAARQRLAPQGH